MTMSISLLQQMWRYNRWANDKMFGVCDERALALMTEAEGGTIGSIGETIKHLVGVEDIYLLMLKGENIEVAFGSREEYFAHDIAWFMHRLQEAGEGHTALLSERDEAWLATPLAVPWFDFPLTMADGEMQVLMHSAQHRAQVLSALGGRGIAVPDIDYVNMLGEAAHPAAER